MAGQRLCVTVGKNWKGKKVLGGFQEVLKKNGTGPPGIKRVTGQILI